MRVKVQLKLQKMQTSHLEKNYNHYLNNLYKNGRKPRYQKMDIYLWKNFKFYNKIRELIMVRILLRKNIFRVFEEQFNVTDFFFSGKSKFQNQIQIKEKELLNQI